MKVKINLFPLPFNTCGRLINIGTGTWRRATLPGVLALVSMLSLSVFSASGPEVDLAINDKIAPHLQVVVANSSPTATHRCWLFIYENSFGSEHIALTERAKQRRKKVDPESFLLDDHDLSIDIRLLDRIRSSVKKVGHVSRWLKALSVEVDNNQIMRLAHADFVKTVTLVKSFRRSPEPEQDRAYKPAAPSRVTALDYGSSLLQNQFIKAAKLHRAGLTGKGVMIGILDSGFKTDHPAFDSASIIATWDFINGNASVTEFGCQQEVPGRHQNNHGTSTASIIVGNLPGSLIGVAPGVDLVLAKTEITCGGVEIKIEEDNWIAAAEWADSIGVDIITSSLGYTLFDDNGSYSFSDLDGNSTLITRAADIAASKNILVINSAGNERNRSWGGIIAPADGDSVIAVGAVESDSSLAQFSSPGPTADGRIKPDITSLGVSVYVASHLGGFKFSNGTSFSAPLVAGGCALAFEHDPTMTAEELRNLIKSRGSRAANPDNDFGYGLFDAAGTADIVRIDSLLTVSLFLSEVDTLHITSSGRSGKIPVITAFNLTSQAILVDSGNGAASLILVGSADNPAQSSIGLVATVEVNPPSAAGDGFFSDTTYLIVETYTPLERQIVAGPNPFSDSVRIFINPNAGKLLSVSIYNVAGEKVWETVNDPYNPADDIIKWDGRNLQGKRLSSGVYLAVVRTERLRESLKLLKID